MISEYNLHVDQAHVALRLARNLLNTQISEYPTPIAGCDAQFNHLLSEHEKISEAIRALKDQPFVPTPRRPTGLVRRR